MFVIRTNSDIPGVRFLGFDGKPKDAELQAYFDFELERIAVEARSQKVTVLSLQEAWTSTQRSAMREFEMRAAGEAREKQLGVAMVVPNSLIRGALTAYLWISRPAYPTTMVATAADAYPFVVERLREAELPTPSREQFERVARSNWRARVVQPGRGLVPITAPNSSRTG